MLDAPASTVAPAPSDEAREAPNEALYNIAYQRGRVDEREKVARVGFLGTLRWLR